MSRVRARLASIALLVVAAVLPAQDAATRGKLSHAQRLVEQKPTGQYWVGLAEMHWAAGQPQAALDALRQAETAGGKLLCWRALTLYSSRPAALRDALSKVKVAGGWEHVAALCLALQEQDRDALLRLADDVSKRPPADFPTHSAEKRHLQLLIELGMTRTQAGMEVLAARSPAGLLVLRDLDSWLTREATYFREAGREADSRRLLGCRDALRAAYLKHAVHIAERDFALDLADHVQQRDALREQVRHVDYLHDRKKLPALVERIGERNTWDLVLVQLLEGELKLLASPPDLGKAKAPTDFTVKADRSQSESDNVVYQGNVHAVLGHLEMRCDRLTAVREKGRTAVLVGTGSVTLHGFPGFAGPIRADRATWSADTASFSLGGDVRLPRWEGLLKARTCTLAPRGEVSELRTLLQDFQDAELPARLALLPRIEKAYTEVELPDDVRYLLALNLLRPHLRWHAPYLAPLPTDRVLREYAKSFDREDSWRWEAALGGETWMLADIPAKVREEVAKSVARRNEEEAKAGIKDRTRLPGLSAYFWRLADPGHADVARASRLLQAVRQDDLARKARRWLEELRRNNTVITADVPGAYPAFRDAPVVLDVRNAERLSFKLYRVRKPDELLWVLDRIGTDFVFHDHGLQYGHLPERLWGKDGKGAEAKVQRDREHAEVAKMPELFGKEPLRQWASAVVDLKRINAARRDFMSSDRDRLSGEDADYFDDACDRFESRLSRRYSPRVGESSSWQCGLIATVPAAVVAEPGAYVLCVEANGQHCYVPLLVEPPALTLRRCRDGVFVMAGDAQGDTPLEGASVHARKMLGSAVTDSLGVAFARVFARGDRAIVVQHGQRFAVGGFGRVFDGLYLNPLDRYRSRGERLRKLEEIRELSSADGHAYSDRHVIAVQTDRPTYRPDQQVHFKLIVRLLRPGEPRPGTFRAEEFEGTKLGLPEPGTRLRYRVINPRGQEVGEGELTLNDFGTAAGAIKLGPEVATGIYSLQVSLSGSERIVPDAFAVRYYRRPHAQLTIQGVPEKLTKVADLDLKVVGRYYTGQSVTGARVLVQLFPAGQRRVLADIEGELDTGTTRLRLQLPKGLAPGNYVVHGQLLDESEQAVTTSVPLVLEGPSASGKGLLSKLPRFVYLKDPIVLDTKLEVTAEQYRYRKDWERHRCQFVPVDGKLSLLWPAPGWWTLRAGDEQRDIFVHGGTTPPWITRSARDHASWDKPEDEGDTPVSRFINLTDYHGEDGHDTESPSHHSGSGSLWALLERQQGNVDDRLRLLVYTPGEEARVLLTIEGRTILDYAVFRTRSERTRYHVIELPLKDRHAPNFYLQGRILSLQGADADRHGPDLAESRRKQRDRNHDGEDPRWCRIDVQAPQRPPRGEQLKVEVRPDRDEYTPGSTVTVELKVTDQKGKPTEAEVSLGAVDESVYFFGEDRVAGLAGLFGDPRLSQRYYRKAWRASPGFRKELLAEAALKQDKAVEVIKEMAELLGQGKDGKGGEGKAPESLVGGRRLLPPGEMPLGTIPAARLREDFRETATWQPQLRTAPDGTIRTSFRLPDSLTSYRLTAVALTKATEIGTARAPVRARLPLAARLFLPRFAVEKDRLQAVGVIRNDTPRERLCELTWEVDGAVLEGVAEDGTPEGWTQSTEGKRRIGRGKVRVPANGSIRVAVWLSFEQAGTAHIALRCQDANGGDAEVRTCPVQPLGREREFTAEGAFRGRHLVKLPDGFVARDLRFVISRGELAQVLDSLGYLVDYPHGCVEQTMSRFLPAVVVQNATRHAPITLPPDVAEKLPKVLEQGLQRLYRFQHGDGGWGWWENDATDPVMTGYVVIGLVRAREAGVRVDADVLSHGCDCLKHLLRQGKLPDVPAAKAWLALTLADRVDTAAVLTEALRLCEDGHSREERGWLALACRQRGLLAEANRLYGLMSGWQPQSPESLALLLRVEMASGIKLEDCLQTAGRLVKMRQGLRWESTQATASAIEALAPLMRYITGRTAVTRLQVLVAGKTVLELKEPQELSPLVYRLRVPRELLPTGEGPTIELRAESETPLLFTLSSAGTQRLDKMEPIGTEVRLRRHLETLDGKPFSGALKPGEVIAVRLRLDLDRPLDYLLVEERRPAGCEYADERIVTGKGVTPASVEFRDDRLCVFFNALPAGKHEIVYWLRAETPGVSHFLPGVAYPMYQEKLRGETGATRLEVTRPAPK